MNWEEVLNILRQNLIEWLVKVKKDDYKPEFVLDNIGEISNLGGVGAFCLAIIDTIKELEDNEFFGDRIETFLDLSDTPNSYLKQKGKYLKVNQKEDGLEFSEIKWGEISGSLNNQTDLKQKLDELETKAIVYSIVFGG
jgi:hypothetical protein